MKDIDNKKDFFDTFLMLFDDKILIFAAKKSRRYKRFKLDKEQKILENVPKYPTLIWKKEQGKKTKKGAETGTEPRKRCNIEGLLRSNNSSYG